MSNQSLTLETSWLFANLNHQERQNALRDVYEQSWSKGQVVLMAHQPCQAVYMVLEGVIRALYLSLEGREFVLDYFVSGDMFNIDAVLTGQPTRFSADVLADARLAVIPCQRFSSWLQDYPAISQALVGQLAHEVYRMGELIEGLALYPVRARLARFLLDHADNKLPRRMWTQGDIAAHIGTVRDVVGRGLREFARRGWIRREQSRLVITNRQALKAEAMRDDEV